MKNEDLIRAFEAVLFAGGEPISIERFSQVFDITPEEVVDVMEKLEKKMKKQNSGLELLRLENTYQLATKAEFAEYIKKAFDLRRRTPLSPAALEVLAVIAYNQPVTRAYIEQVRGVDSTRPITVLLDRELIEEVGRLEVIGRPRLFGVTQTFFRTFGISSLEELPSLDLFGAE